MIGKKSSYETYAIIPARAGSKGLKDKNIRVLLGYPLIAYSIAAARLCPYINRIILSTNSEKYAEIARYYGAETPFLRPDEISGDNSPDIEFINHCINWLDREEHHLPDLLVHLRPTTPLREISLIEEAVKMINDDKNATSLRSVHRYNGTPQKWVLINDLGYYEPLIKEMTMDEVNKPRQEFDTVFIPDGYIDVLRTDFIRKFNLMHGENVKSFVVPESIDVDAMSDLDKVIKILKNEGHPILRFLRENYRPLQEVF